MNNYLLVINAGSSSIKFAIYQQDASSTHLSENAAGQIEGIGSQPGFSVKRADGDVLVERTLSVEEIRAHTDAINIILFDNVGDYVDQVLRRGGVTGIEIVVVVGCGSAVH